MGVNKKKSSSLAAPGCKDAAMTEEAWQIDTAATEGKEQIDVNGAEEIGKIGAAEDGSVDNSFSVSSEETEAKAKRTAKDSVFIHLFKIKKYLLELYRTLHPDDVEVTEQDIEIITIENVMTDNLYNDLGILVSGDKLLILVEAQSTWTVNILLRILLYLAHSYLEYFNRTGQSLYGSKKVKPPRPEFYVIYTGKQGKKPDVLSMSREFFQGEDVGIEVKIKVFYENGKDDIINQYILFCKVFDSQRKLHGLTEKTVKETIRICKDSDILKEYLESREKEVESIMTSLFDQEQIMKTYIQSREKEAAEKSARKLIENGKLPLEDIADCFPALTMEELKAIEAEVRPLSSV